MKTFEEFWPFYLGEHRHPVNRALHLVGTTLGLLIAIHAVWSRTWALLPAALVSGYAFAWVGHFVIEKNRPATFTHPLWSFLGDWKMWGLAVTGRLPAELERLALRAEKARA
ncbi:MAG TPA: DUF962 domain-containing protein [Myxococcaceae bacterium]|nr:DUF962 domain-containing protein [Myxococcaceae bacterium]